MRYFNINVKIEKYKEKYVCINIYIFEIVFIIVVYVNDIELVWLLFLYNYIWMFYLIEIWFIMYIK